MGADFCGLKKKESDTQEYMIDSSSIKAHPHAAGCPRACQSDEALGRSKGGFTTKIHAVVDALGYPVALSLTPGNRNDITQAEALLENIQCDKLIADKGAACPRVGGEQQCVTPVSNPSKHSACYTHA